MKWQNEIAYYIDGKGILCCRYRKACMVSWKDDIYLNIEYRNIGAYKNLHNKPTIWACGSKVWHSCAWPIKYDLVIKPTADLIFVDDTIQFVHSEIGHDFSRVKIITYAPQDLKRPIRDFVKGLS